MAGINSSPENNKMDDFESDFLAREKEILGAEADLFSTGEPTKVPQQPVEPSPVADNDLFQPQFPDG